MKIFALTVLLAALAAMAHGGGAIGACGTQASCAGECRARYGPQAEGTCQENEDAQRCICLHTNRPVVTGECDAPGGCMSVCMEQYGYQADGFCQTSEDQERCICINVGDWQGGPQGHLRPTGLSGLKGRPGPKGQPGSRGHPGHPPHKHV